MLCGRHPKKEVSMIESKLTYVDKVTKKEIVEESLMCPRCYQTVSIDPELRIVLDEYKNGRIAETTTIRKTDILPDKGK